MSLKNLYLTTASLLLLTACSNDDAEPSVTNNGPIPIMLGTSIDDAETRSGVSIQNDRFNPSSIVDVKIVEQKDVDPTVTPQGYDLLRYQVTSTVSGTLTPINKVYPYYPISGNSVNIYGIYPSVENTYFLETSSFSVQDTQLNQDNYIASDLMVGKVISQPAVQTTVTIPFRHMLSKVIVTLKAGSNEDLKNSKIYLLNVAKTIALHTDDYSLGDVIESSRGTIHMSNDGSASSAAIIVPQTVPSGVLIQIELNNHDVVNYKMPQDMVFASGKKYTFNITVVEERLVVNYQIDDWTSTDDHEQTIKL